MMTSSNENISALLGLCAGNSPIAGEFPSQRASDAELWCFLWSAPLINGWINNREAGDLRRHRGHYDVIVMFSNGLAVHAKDSIVIHVGNHNIQFADIRDDHIKINGLKLYIMAGIAFVFAKEVKHYGICDNFTLWEGFLFCKLYYVGIPLILWTILIPQNWDILPVAGVALDVHWW